MNKHRFILSSLVSKIFIIITTAFYFVLFAISIMKISQEDRLKLIVCSLMLLPAFVCVCVQSLRHRIIIDKERDLLIITYFKKWEIPLKNVKELKVDANSYCGRSSWHCFIDIYLKDGKKIAILGYSSMAIGRRNERKTQKIVDEINEIIKNYEKNQKVKKNIKR